MKEKKLKKPNPDSVKKVWESDISATQNSSYRKDIDKAMPWLANTIYSEHTFKLQWNL